MKPFIFCLLLLLLVQQIDGTYFDTFGGEYWTPTGERKVFILHDLEKSPLKIKTDSQIPSSDEIRIVFYSSEADSTLELDSTLGGIRVKFTDPPQYWVGWCSSEWTEFVLPEKNCWRIWTIKEMESSVYVSCDGEEVVNYVFSESEKSRCQEKWGGDVVKMMFWEDDTASDEYRPVGGKTCADIREQAFCDYRKSMGECRGGLAGWKTYMSEDCPATCGLCGFTAVTRDVMIQYDLEAFPLQIKTNSHVVCYFNPDTAKHINLHLYTAGIQRYGGYYGYSFITEIKVRFSNPPKYHIKYCTDGWTNFPVDWPPEIDEDLDEDCSGGQGTRSTDKNWTIYKTATALKIVCNNVEVLNYVYSGSSLSSCVYKLMNEVGNIWFPKTGVGCNPTDTASNMFTPLPQRVCEWGSTLSNSYLGGDSKDIYTRVTYSSSNPEEMNGNTFEENVALCKEDCENNYLCNGLLFTATSSSTQSCRMVHCPTEDCSSVLKLDNGFYTMLVTCDINQRYHV